MKKIQNFYLNSYRLVGFVFLTGLIVSILWYVFSLLFFISNSSWTVPMILSPNQEKVMAHLEHVLSFEHDVTKNKAEVIASEQILKHKQSLLKINQQLLERFNESLVDQSKNAVRASNVYKKLNNAQIANMNHLSQLITQIHHEDQVIDQELKMGLITKQEALLAHVAWSKLLTSWSNSKASIFDFKQRVREYDEASNTLTGSGNHLKWMSRVIKKVELESQISELKSDIFTLTVTTKLLKKNIDKKNKVLSFMKSSPYIQATRKATTVAFVPYHNLNKVKIGAPIYSCYLEMIFCYKSGQVSSIYNGEEYSSHPIFKSNIKGQLIGVDFINEADAQKQLLFINSKPLLI